MLSVYFRACVCGGGGVVGWGGGGDGGGGEGGGVGGGGGGGVGCGGVGVAQISPHAWSGQGYKPQTVLRVFVGWEISCLHLSYANGWNCFCLKFLTPHCVTYCCVGSHVLKSKGQELMVCSEWMFLQIRVGCTRECGLCYLRFFSRGS